jgi:hypothetical protein
MAISDQAQPYAGAQCYTAGGTSHIGVSAVNPAVGAAVTLACVVVTVTART